MKELTLPELWRRMDEAWAALDLDEHAPDPVRLAAFYRHPVWAENGAFIECDPISLGHRLALVRSLAWMYPARLLDYGGGFGAFARMYAAAAPQTVVEVYEPYPAYTALECATAFPNLHYVDRISGVYAAIVALDVLEHLTDPLQTLAELTAALEPGGRLVVANHFYPVIRCHLPGTFYLRYSFGWFARALGLSPLGGIAGSPAIVYRRTRAIAADWPRLRRMERLARSAYPALRQAHRLYRQIRRRPDAPL